MQDTHVSHVKECHSEDSAYHLGQVGSKSYLQGLVLLAFSFPILSSFAQSESAEYGMLF